MLQMFYLFYNFSVFIGVLQDSIIPHPPSGFTYPCHKHITKQGSSICTKYIVDNGYNIK